MSERPPWAQEAPPPSPETPAQRTERVEAAATRRRWITLAEVVGVAGLVIAALGLWTGWSDRRADQAEHRAEKADADKARSIVTLAGTVEDGGARLALKDAGHDVQSIDVRFPTALGLSPRSSLLDPRIERDWFAAPLLKLTDGGPDTREGRLPVLIAASWWDGDRQRLDRAIYDIVWKTEGRVLRGRTLRLEGIVLRERPGGNGPARLDALWARESPRGS